MVTAKNAKLKLCVFHTPMGDVMVVKTASYVQSMTMGEFNCNATMLVEEELSKAAWWVIYISPKLDRM